MKINWKLKLAIGLIIASAILYTIAYFGFHEPDKVIFYIVIDLAFIPLDILIVALVIESLIEKKERDGRSRRSGSLYDQYQCVYS